MRTRQTCLKLLVAAAFAFGAFSVAQADLINITDGTNNFQWNPDNGTSVITATFDANYSAGFVPMLRFQNTGASGLGLVTLNMGDFTGGGISKNVVTNSASSVGDTGSQHVDFGWQTGLGGLNDLFDVDMSFVVSTHLGSSQINYSMTVTNSSGATRTNVELFSYYDWDLVDNQNTGIDWVEGAFTGFHQSGSGDPASEFAFHGTDNLQNWEVAAWDTIAPNLLANGSLSNSGTPFPLGDMVGAFGWNIGTMAAGESFTVNMLIVSVPEPATASLMLFGLVGVGLMRRRSR